MAFHRVYRNGADPAFIDPLYIAGTNLESFAVGEMVVRSSGKVTKAIPGGPILGVLEIKGAQTGDGSTELQVVGHEADAVFEVDGSGLASTTPGANCDLNSAGTGVDDPVYGDFVIVEDHGAALDGNIWVKIVNRES